MAPLVPPRLAAVLVWASPSVAWISESQAKYGLTIDRALNESHGKDVGSPQQSLGYLWTQPPTSAYLPSPKSPQSHLARSRGEYTFEGAPGRRHRVRGRPFWASAPVELNCSAGGGSGGGRAAPSVVVCAALPLSPMPPGR